MANALTVYWTNTVSTDLPNAVQIIAPATSTGSHVGIDNALGTATGYGEWFFKGNLSAWAGAGGTSAPDGNGALYDVTALEGLAIAAGVWTPTLRGNVNAGNGSITADLLMRVWKYNTTSLTYTAIGTMTNAGVTLTGSTASYTFAGTSLAEIDFYAGDKIYLDLWVNVKTNANTLTGATLRFNVVSGTTNGDINCRCLTPGTITLDLLVATATAVGTMTADVAIGHFLATTATAIGAMTADSTIGHPLATTGTIIGAMSADVAIGHPLAATATAIGAITADVAIGHYLATTATAIGTISADSTIGHFLATTATIVGSASGIIITTDNINHAALVVTTTLMSQPRGASVLTDVPTGTVTFPTSPRGITTGS